MQEAFFVASELADGLYGPYSRPVADRVLKIVRMASDETAELEVAEVDMFGEQLQSGLLPFKVGVVVLQGKVQSVQVSLCWPPVPEGILVEREDYREYFVWAKNQSEAKTRLAGLAKARAQDA
ncbi:MAG: hypothetical protein QG575_1848 [Euryarchaeota archaeon]|nr:hypothetical protein [Euryarchaeota archaeon]